MKEHFLKVQRTARYYVIGDLNPQTENVWIVCHGYAMLAGEFIKDFEPLLDGKTAIIAPEGMNRFYTKGFFGKVGATWMTREDRLNEIEDHVGYLQQLYKTIRSQVGAETKFHALGFSQGCATVCRWVAFKMPEIARLWICSGEIPKDLDWGNFQTLSEQCKVMIIYGTRDPFIQESILKNMENLLSTNSIKYEIKTFDGEHVIYTPLLR